jgi:hypothetical protein
MADREWSTTQLPVTDPASPAPPDERPGWRLVSVVAGQHRWTRECHPTEVGVDAVLICFWERGIANCETDIAQSCSVCNGVGSWMLPDFMWARCKRCNGTGSLPVA